MERGIAVGLAERSLADLDGVGDVAGGVLSRNERPAEGADRIDAVPGARRGDVVVLHQPAQGPEGHALVAAGPGADVLAGDEVPGPRRRPEAGVRADRLAWGERIGRRHLRRDLACPHVGGHRVPEDLRELGKAGTEAHAGRPPYMRCCCRKEALRARWSTVAGSSGDSGVLLAASVAATSAVPASRPLASALRRMWSIQA